MPSLPPRTHPLSRRDLLRRSGMGLGTVGLAGLLAQDGLLAAPRVNQNNLLTPRQPHFPARAKRVIHFFLNGGPSHVDTFDPKPELTRQDGKLLQKTFTPERKTGAAFASPFRFRRYGESGIEVSDLFARTAEHADDIAVIRSMYAQVPNHEPSLMLMNCGDSLQARPSFGAWTLYGLGTENENLPGFIAMCPGGLPIKDSENWQAAFLPGAYQGTYIDPSKKKLSDLIANIEPRHITAVDQRRQLDLIARWNARHREARHDARLDARIHSYELAFGMQQDASEAFDISRERGVRFVQLWHGGGQPWDNHTQIKNNHQKLAAEIDQPIAALLTDLKQRGMLDDTIVLWGGEFGRTPTVELAGDGKSQLGRDHNHYGFSVWLAGGGIRGGTVYGATDEFGFAAQQNPTSAHDLHATMLHLLGLDHEALTYRYAGRDFRLTDVHGEIIRDIIA